MNARANTIDAHLFISGVRVTTLAYLWEWLMTCHIPFSVLYLAVLYIDESNWAVDCPRTYITSINLAFEISEKGMIYERKIFCVGVMAKTTYCKVNILTTIYASKKEIKNIVSKSFKRHIHVIIEYASAILYYVVACYPL